MIEAARRLLDRRRCFGGPVGEREHLDPHPLNQFDGEPYQRALAALIDRGAHKTARSESPYSLAKGVL